MVRSGKDLQRSSVNKIKNFTRSLKIDFVIRKTKKTIVSFVKISEVQYITKKTFVFDKYKYTKSKKNKQAYNDVRLKYVQVRLNFIWLLIYLEGYIPILGT